MTTDADEYAELFDGEVHRVLDIDAVLQTCGHRHIQHNIHHLCDDVRQAKQVYHSTAGIVIVA